MRKLYTQYTDSELNTPFMVTFEGNQVQACANDGDTITIGSTEYVRVTDGSGHDVKAVIPNSGDETPHKLLVRLGDENSHDLCYIEDGGVVSSTSIQVTDIVPAPAPVPDVVLSDYDTENWRWNITGTYTQPVSNYALEYVFPAQDVAYEIQQYQTGTGNPDWLGVSTLGTARDLTYDSYGEESVIATLAQDEYVSKIVLYSDATYRLEINSISGTSRTVTGLGDSGENPYAAQYLGDINSAIGESNLSDTLQSIQGFVVLGSEDAVTVYPTVNIYFNQQV